MRSLDCTVTSYLVQSMIPKEKVFPMTCDHEAYPQACAHYYSAIREGNMPARFTCAESHAKNGMEGGTATFQWEPQHKNKEWKSYTVQHVVGSKAPVCEPDAYPPDYFLSNNRTTAQLVRWLPRSDNGGAQDLWRGFCDKHDGNVGSGQRVKPVGGQRYDSPLP